VSGASVGWLGWVLFIVGGVAMPAAFEIGHRVGSGGAQKWMRWAYLLSMLAALSAIYLVAVFA